MWRELLIYIGCHPEAIRAMVSIRLCRAKLQNDNIFDDAIYKLNCFSSIILRKLIKP